ncbi:proteasome activator complex subunit 2 isoform X2 [Sceloporus undulatus]|nr:proteasome activator complex subunit 2 isoform X2 [Sceloporus undulatus]XP_042327880.1 proteasome activator complex subunit 2 isoform X2 [Sceloporus undulatus]
MMPKEAGEETFFICSKGTLRMLQGTPMQNEDRREESRSSYAPKALCACSGAPCWCQMKAEFWPGAPMAEEKAAPGRRQTGRGGGGEGGVTWECESESGFCRLLLSSSRRSLLWGSLSAAKKSPAAIMAKSCTALQISKGTREKMACFRESLLKEGEEFLCKFLPAKIFQLDQLLKEDALNVKDLTSLRAPLDIPIPDPPPKDDEMETEKEEKEAPKCGYLKGNEILISLLDRIKPEVREFKEKCVLVTTWIQFMIPKIEDGNDFGVAVQEKVLERITALKTKVEAFQTAIAKYYLERGDAVAKASKETHVMDYRCLVHERDEAIYREIQTMVLDIRGFYAELYHILSKNLEKLTNPKGEEKPSMY